MHENKRFAIDAYKEEGIMRGNALVAAVVVVVFAGVVVAGVVVIVSNN